MANLRNRLMRFARLIYDLQMMVENESIPELSPEPEPSLPRATMPLILYGIIIGTISVALCLYINNINDLHINGR